MQSNLKLNYIKPKSYHSGSSLVKGIVVFYVDKFYVKVKDKLYNVDAYNFEKAKVLYSKPNNDKYESWTKIKYNHKPTNSIDIIKRYWATLKNSQKVYGKIENDKFIIKKK